jgi:heat-inducible transcriptional repressor
MATTALDERSRDVLRTLIHLHVSTGEPVGSASLAQAMGRTLSAATLRNIMAELERSGYLEHPHTSAGRMPTDEGYRFYVDSLMSHRPLPPRELAAIDSELGSRDAPPNRVIENASHILSRLSHNVGFVVATDLSRASFRHIDLVRLAHPRVLVVMVSRTGLVTNRVIEVEEDLSQDQLQTCQTYLNTHFAGMTLAGIRAALLDLMVEEKALYDSLLRHVLSVGRAAFAEESEETSVYLDGTANILEQTDFEDMGRMRNLFRAFEEKSRLVKILNACLRGEGVRIVIGHEIPDPALADLSLVTSFCPVEGDAGWALGVLGPSRMEYSRVISLVEHVAGAVCRALTELRS